MSAARPPTALYCMAGAACFGAVVVFGLFSTFACGKTTDSESGAGASGAFMAGAGHGGRLENTGGERSTQAGGRATNEGGVNAEGGAAGADGAGGHPRENSGGNGANGGSASGGVGAGFSGGGTGAAAGGGATAGLPPASEQEAEIIAPLFGEDTAILAASGAELIALARKVGFAHGYAMCRCLIWPSSPPADLEALFPCARDEFGTLRPLSTESSARCVTEDMGTVPGYEDYLRCSTLTAKSRGRGWLESCKTGVAPTTLLDCEQPPGTEQLEFACTQAFYCGDGTRLGGARVCDDVADCVDLADEAHCF